jgi:hypothetical protein
MYVETYATSLYEHMHTIISSRILNKSNIHTLGGVLIYIAGIAGC